MTPGPRAAPAATATSTTVVETRLGPLEVHGEGVGDPLLLVHGVLVDSTTLWSGVSRDLATDHRCIRPDLPLGGHRLAPTARVTVDSVVGALVDVLDGLGVERATLVGNDSGGALCQVLAARHPERVARLVLTSCDAYRHFPPTPLKPVKPLLAVPGALDLLGLAYRSRRVRRSFAGAGLATAHHADAPAIHAAFGRFVASRANRADFGSFLRSCRPAVTTASIDRLRGWSTPTLIAWSRGDPLFPEADARRLAADLGGELTWIEGSRAFSPLDRPAQVAAAVRDFTSRRAA